jgi:hypothetical protein
MAISTYAELQSAIADFLDRDDLTSVIPTFIYAAEKQMEKEIRHPRMMRRSEGQIDSRYSPVPPTWLETIRLHISGTPSYRLELTSLDDMLQLREQSGGGSGRPTHYAHFGENIEVYPNPDTEYDIELMYYEKLPFLSDSNTSNWLLEVAPEAYLYGALVHSAPYLKDDARLQVWGSLYAGAVAGVNKQADQARFGGSGLRMRVRSY